MARIPTAYADRPYRPCVGLMLIDARGLVFVAQRIDQVAEAWQMPQGGIDEGEDPRAAALRELTEETAIPGERVRILAESADWIPYDLPPAIADKVWKGRFRGQTQKWYLLRLEGPDSLIDLETDEPEFNAWKWVPVDDVVEYAIAFKRENYARIVEEFRPHCVPAA